MKIPLAAASIALIAILSSCSRSTSNPLEPVSAPAPGSAPATAPPATPTSQLSAHIWRVESSASRGFLGSIYIFVPDGTLLETSCKETYRIAAWSPDPKSPQSFQVVEDGRVAFTATVRDATATSLSLDRRLMHGETDQLKLTAMMGEFVCPDLR
jgi:hypothetical protein